MIRRPPRSTLSSSSAASDVYKRQYQRRVRGLSDGGHDGATRRLGVRARARARAQGAEPTGRAQTGRLCLPMTIQAIDFLAPHDSTGQADAARVLEEYRRRIHELDPVGSDQNTACWMDLGFEHHLGNTRMATWYSRILVAEVEVAGGRALLERRLPELKKFVGGASKGM
eukprot:TRINITY_DN605_c0_g1_i5.p1 TRINITY_DN605_c0_g1~~TRINITY_DN605_c0_g1_i5.p1  ORF type:complete len:170 (-),score=34.98 TRINITY_DN605_c0_g1_i5:61-570(-)